MIINYFKIAWRNVLKGRLYSSINIIGLATGIAVALLIGLWIWDELSFNKTHQNYHSIAQVMQSQTLNGETRSQVEVPIPLAAELRTKYGSAFKHVVLSTKTGKHILSAGEKKLTKTGNFMEPEAPELFTLKMLQGTRAGLSDPTSVLLSQSLANTFFGEADPIGKLLKIDDTLNVNVTGVYEDLPYNSTLKDVSFIAPWQLYVSSDERIKQYAADWDNNGWQIYVQVAGSAGTDLISAKIRDARFRNMSKDFANSKPSVFLQPMSKWHLYSEFKNGVNVGGRIQYVKLFGVIGLFVLLLACINFMNLSTARSEKRAKEVGVRKAVGSMRGQLVGQFLCESVLMTFLAFIVSIALVQLALQLFNELADKKMSFPWSNLVFWLLALGFVFVTGIIAGSYPAFYLSGFNPVKVLKGTLRPGRSASFPRKMLVVAQFTVSIILIIGTIIVFRQIQFAKNRPVGYNRDGLIVIETLTNNIHNHYAAVRNDLLNTGVVEEMAESSNPTTNVSNEQSNFEWNGKEPNSTVNIGTIGITHEFGKTVGWQIREGRDFSRNYESDAMGFVINEAAKKAMRLKNPVGETVKWMGYNFKIIGVVKDMVMKSPYDPVSPAIFFIAPWWINVVNIKMKPGVGINDALAKIEAVIKKYNPDEPFDYKFVDDEYAKKFSDEKRIGDLATVFAILAIFISCLGLFGLASFVAEQRKKEIGVRKVLGASVINVWGLLSKEFVVLVIISMLIAAPAAYYFMSAWLESYQYRTEISWWIFVAAGTGALTITLLTVSFQAIKAATANPVKSLRTE